MEKPRKRKKEAPNLHTHNVLHLEDWVQS